MLRPLIELTDVTFKDSFMVLIGYVYRRVKKLLESSSNIALGGDSNAQDRYISPTVLADVTFKDSVMQEEVSTVYVLN